jgi:D-alanyl-lipoteichoic acid acyltransferase DltB (MBOAT superfamily)
MLTITNAIFLTLLCSCGFHLIPRKNWRARLWLVTLLSMLIVFAYYPLAALIAAASGVYSWGVVRAAQFSKPIAKYGPFTILFFLAAFSVNEIWVPTDPYSSTLVQFGMSFYVLRLYLAMRTSINNRQPAGLEELLLIALFFPIFPAGPICAQEAFTKSPLADRPVMTNYLAGFLRIGMGICALYIFSPIAGELIEHLAKYSPKNEIDWPAMNFMSVYAVMLLNFLKLYAGFAGYTEVAIGLALFFGFQVPENFRYPFLATNIQNFWQRWHLSLSRFITNQIYLPLMLSLRKPRLAIFLSFLLVGFWHNINLQYLVWGLGHGLALVLYMTFSKNRKYIAVISRTNRVFHIAISWLLTMSLVSFLSTFANEATFENSIAFAKALVAPG